MKKNENTQACPSVRAQVITRRTYNRPTETGYETWEQTVDRVIAHQKWLWARAAGFKNEYSSFFSIEGHDGFTELKEYVS